MRRYLVVANQTLLGLWLGEELRARIRAAKCSFFVLVPGTRAEHYDPVGAGGMLPPAGMWWWATDYAGPDSDEEAAEQAAGRLRRLLADLAALGVPAEGDLGSADPLAAIETTLAGRDFDEIIVATLPRRVSRWLGADLPHQAERFGLPVTTVIARPAPPSAQPQAESRPA